MTTENVKINKIELLSTSHLILLDSPFRGKHNILS